MSARCVTMCSVDGGGGTIRPRPNGAEELGIGAKELWGRVTWSLLHSYAQSPMCTKQHMVDMIETLSDGNSDTPYPCAQCRSALKILWQHMKGHSGLVIAPDVSREASLHYLRGMDHSSGLSTTRLDDFALEKNETMGIVEHVSTEHLIYALHNEVSRRLAKPLWTLRKFEDERHDLRRVQHSGLPDCRECLVGIELTETAHKWDATVQRWWERMIDLCRSINRGHLS